VSVMLLWRRRQAERYQEEYEAYHLNLPNLQPLGPGSFHQDV